MTYATLSPYAQPFHAWGKTSRVDSPVVVTEKIDGTNGVIHVAEGGIFVGARNGWIASYSWFGDGPEWYRADNYGFGAYAITHAEELADLLGGGYHYGEWWGHGIARGYGQEHKRFQLFDIRHSAAPGWDEEAWETCRLGTVPVLYEGPMDHLAISDCVRKLERLGSIIAPGYKHPEGLVVRFDHNGVRFKKVLDKVGPPVERPAKVGPPKVKWTQEQIDAARAAAAQRKEVTGRG